MTNILIGKCEYCGRLNCTAHRKYTDRCEECGRRYARFMDYKSRLRNKYTNRGQIMLDKVVDEYKILLRKGYKVPRQIAEGWNGDIIQNGGYL